MTACKGRSGPSVRLAAACAGLFSLALAAGAGAQGLDRNALEELFGEPVTTSATGKPQRASDVPVAMDIITAEQIRRSGANDIPTVLARFTSLDVQQYGPQDFSVTARGYAAPNTQRMLVLVNGRQVYLDAFGRTSWDNLPVQLSEIRQIEVVRGPNSALFGFNAVAGVINILTFDPAHDRVTNLVARGGTRHYGEVSGVVTAPLGGGSGLRVSGGLREQDAWRRGYEAFELGIGAGRDVSHGQFAADASFRISDAVWAGFDASYSRSIGTEFQLPGLLLPWDVKTWSLRGRMTAETGAGLIGASIYHNALDTNLAGTPLLSQGVTIAQLSDTVKLNAAHTLRPFLEYRHNTISTRDQNGSGSFIDTSPLRGLEGGYDVAAAGVMWNWAVTPSLEWTGALRYDHLWLQAKGFDSPFFPFQDRDYDRDYGALSWNAGLVWRATDIETVRLSASRGVGVPGFFDMGARVVVPSFGLAIIGSPLLKPSTADNYEIGYSRQVAAIDGRVGVTGFYQTNRNVSASLGAFPTGGLPSAIIPYNLDSSQAYGVELSAAGRLGGNFDWGAEYRLAAVEEGDRSSLANFGHASPRNLVSARLGWGQGPLRADLFARYATSLEGYRVTDRGILPVRVGDHASVAARLGYKLAEGVTVAIEGSNLLHERQRQGIGAEAERSVYLSLRFDF
ncbi:TonB-dependent receptor plug domain-containing protein [Muricoccus pecuniae]|uniref:Iron complex outermembrane receptor protein n=1 Tax=Muricoccus pecuniae TaxID=693023 RepID=A0A840YJ68_9PROT|nr:TonB-dependent receptor [Roseomonas pecuniae]MBB5694173.1 iron complex outermembrane receptor protein [Roseomonas pecuniae]